MKLEDTHSHINSQVVSYNASQCFTTHAVFSHKISIYGF